MLHHQSELVRTRLVGRGGVKKDRKGSDIRKIAGGERNPTPRGTGGQKGTPPPK